MLPVQNPIINLTHQCFIRAPSNTLVIECMYYYVCVVIGRVGVYQMEGQINNIIQMARFLNIDDNALQWFMKRNIYNGKGMLQIDAL